jgi:OmpA-OmpF porin, OOP family
MAVERDRLRTLLYLSIAGALIALVAVAAVWAAKGITVGLTFASVVGLVASLIAIPEGIWLSRRSGNASVQGKAEYLNETRRGRHSRPGGGGRRLLRAGVLLLTVSIVAGMLVLAHSIMSGEPTSSKPGALAVIVGAHSNAPKPQMRGQADRDLHSFVRLPKSVTIIRNSSDPRVYDQSNPGCHGRLTCDGEATKLESIIENVKAIDAGNNLLSALDLSARALSDVRGTKRIDVVDSGLQTEAPLAFQAKPPLLDATPTEVVSALQHAGELPNLHGISVLLTGIGQTVAPQRTLTISQRTNLVNIWEAICIAAGASSVNSDLTPLTLAPLPNMPAMPPIAVPTPANAPDIGHSEVVIPSGSLGFVPDQAQLVNENQAKQLLAVVASQLRQTVGTIRVTGTTSDTGTASSQLTLSLARAKTVASLLEELGIPAARITTVGVGSHWPGFVKDRNSLGQLIPDRAAANRVVIIQVLPK